MKDKPTKAKCPKTRIEDGVEYLTKGKTYDISKWDKSGNLFYITDDTGMVLHCLIENCAHVEPKQWELS